MDDRIADSCLQPGHPASSVVSPGGLEVYAASCGSVWGGNFKGGEASRDLLGTPDKKCSRGREMGRLNSWKRFSSNDIKK